VADLCGEQAQHDSNLQPIQSYAQAYAMGQAKGDNEKDRLEAVRIVFEDGD